MTNNFYEYKCYNCVWGLVHATPKEYENTALFLRLHLLSWNAFRSNLKTPALRFSVDKTQFQNGVVWNQWRHDNCVVSLTEVS